MYMRCLGRGQEPFFAPPPERETAGKSTPGAGSSALSVCFRRGHAYINRGPASAPYPAPRRKGELASGIDNEAEMTGMDFELARRNMVDSQIRTNKVTDPLVLKAFRSVPRELFVPAPLKGVAYLDDDLKVAPGRTLIEPMVLARLLQLAEIRTVDTVLDVGGATGYGTAILGRMASSVVTLEEDPTLVKWASETLLGLGVDNAVVVEGPLAAGLPDQGPYDVIVVEGAIEQVPEGLREQLNEGGRLVAVVKDKGVGRATLVTRRGGAFGHRMEFEANLPMLPGFAKAPAFVF